MNRLINAVNKFYLLCNSSSQEDLDLIESLTGESGVDGELSPEESLNLETSSSNIRSLPSYSEISIIDETARSKIPKKDRSPTKSIGVLPLTSQQLLAKLVKGSKRGRNNIRAVYNFATDEEKNYWGNWYLNASEDVKKLASIYGVPFEQAAAVVAVLSPGNKWKDNLMAAAKIFSESKTVNAYPKNIEKANKIKNSTSNYFEHVTGPKVSVFLKSLLSPMEINKEIVLDSHAINIWFGKKVNLKLTPSISEALRRTIIADYERVADEIGIKPMLLQAVTWYIWKYLSSEPSPGPAPKSVKNPEAEN